MLTVSAVRVEMIAVANFRGVSEFWASPSFGASQGVGLKKFSSQFYSRTMVNMESPWRSRNTSRRIKFTTFKFRPHQVYRLRPRPNFFPATFVKRKSFDRFTIAERSDENKPYVEQSLRPSRELLAGGLSNRYHKFGKFSYFQCFRKKCF